MSTTYGMCPNCKKEKRLTAQRRLVASHIAQGVKCPGSGQEPTAITRTVEPPAVPDPAQTTRPKAPSPAPTAGQANPKKALPRGALYAAVLTLLFLVASFALGSTGHQALALTAMALALVFCSIAWNMQRRASMTPQDVRSREEQRRRELERRNAIREFNQEQARQARRQKLGPPPPGAVPPSPKAAFLRLNQNRFRGISGGPLASLVCGRCAYNYSVPMSLVREYRSELSPGASLRRVGQPAVAMRQDMAQLNLRCPRCGSIDPGLWIEV